MSLGLLKNERPFKPGHSIRIPSNRWEKFKCWLHYKWTGRNDWGY